MSIDGVLKAEIEAERAILDAEYKQDGWLWACEQVQTVDEATQRRVRWPQDKPYLKEVWDLLDSESKLAFPKSRRMMVSWLVAVWSVWRCRYWPYNAIYIQSDKEEKSAYLVDRRCYFVEHNLVEPWNAKSFSSIKTKDGQVGRMRYVDTESVILAIAQGASKVRSYTCSALIMDECEFQDEAHEALTAALAMVEENKNVKLILISTSNGPQGVLAGICEEVGFVRWN